MNMPGNRILLFVAIAISVCGCEKKDVESVKVENDIAEISNWLTGIDRPAMEFGTALAARISKLRDPRQRDKYRARMEATLFSSSFETVDYNERFRRIGIFCDLVGCCGHETSPHSSNILLALRRLEKIKAELSNVTRTKETGDIMLDCYICKLTTTVNSLTEQFEKLFNKWGDELSANQRTSVLKDFAQIMGRPIRTDEEIKRDRQRRIDAKIEEARRRQEERLGNDVKVDIDSL